MPSVTAARGLTVADVAARLRVSRDKVRAWIGRGELAAINTSSARCRKPRYVITPESLAAFEIRHVVTPEKPAPRRQKKTNGIDYFPDWR